MFKNIGYLVKETYENSICYYKDEELKDIGISFNLKDRTFDKTEYYHDAGDITMEELKVINTKCRELRMDIRRKKR